MKLFSRFFRKKKNIVPNKIEQEFNKGNIILPSGIRDYNDYDDFKSKTKDIIRIQEKLKVIEEDKINGK